MESLSGLDAAFLYLESDTIPMHIGGVAILQGSLAYEDFVTFMQQRVHTVPRLRQKLVSVPMSLDRPYWVDDPDFDLSNHLAHRTLPSPGGWRELRAMASDIFSGQIDRHKPLWEFVFVDGIEDIAQVPKGSIALVSKIHHAGFDGKSGADLMSMLFDVSPTPRPVPPADKAPSTEEAPGNLGLLGRTAMNLVSRPTQLPGLLWDAGKAALKASYLTRIEGLKPPTLPFSAPKSILNTTVERQRCWDSAVLDLSRVKLLRRGVKGASLNDAVLAICAGAIRRYLLEKNELPEDPIVAMVPVSTRTNEEKNAMGNQVAAMYVQLATDIDDPLERFKTIVQNTKTQKEYQKAVDARSLMGFAELIPFGLAGAASRFYSKMALAKRHNPLFNLVITNVPGPPIPVYLSGHELLVNMGTAPLYDGMGLMIPVFSYNNTLSISPTSAENIMPDINVFARYLRESALELEALVEKRVSAFAALNALISNKEHHL
ncbi:WS/DGAT/MGAT family O-acyltransferase [Alteromonas facilis]|uniref:WS/DGAT/MGAT family O-acyltransferase n=1 Tax=Alteromonas facilis TaxID=2048004 RepID=UPI000C287B87|nr:wax ester/triacylglycerol synthase family O-acyltransferase [Alteromonas facilis]